MKSQIIHFSFSPFTSITANLPKMSCNKTVSTPRGGGPFSIPFPHFKTRVFSLFEASLVPYNNNILISLLIGFVTLTGNILFPIILRIIFVILRKFSYNPVMQGDIDELLANPRNYYFLLFPLDNTVALFGYWLFMTIVEWMIFFVEWDNVDVYGAWYSSSTKVMINFIQTLFVRSCGLNNTNVGSLHEGHIVFLLSSMFLSVFPIMITLRLSNIVRQDDPKSRAGRFMKRLLARDLIWLFIAILLITFIEDNTKSTNPIVVPNFFLFICFEVVSAFGTVGLSLGYPGHVYSYCGAFTGVSKFIIIMTMVAGRHRGLPESIDPVFSVRLTRSIRDKE